MEAVKSKRLALWVGRVLSAMPVLLLVMSGSMKLFAGPKILPDFVGKFGYPASTLTAIGLLEVLCTVVYVVPRTAVLGAVLLTSYLGGAVATQVRIGEAAFALPALLGVLVWTGLYLRDPRLRAFLPVRRAPPA